MKYRIVTYSPDSYAIERKTFWTWATIGDDFGPLIFYSIDAAKKKIDEWNEEEKRWRGFKKEVIWTE